MKRAVAIGLGLAGLALAISLAWSMRDQARRQALAVQERQNIEQLEQERGRLQARLEELLPKDPRFEGMPDTAVRIGVPTSLAQMLIERVVTGFVDQVELELRNIRAHTSGSIRKLVTIGSYELDVVVESVRARLQTSRPTVTFGGNTIGLGLQVHVAEGHGRATVRFRWDGRNVGGMVCGDMDIGQVVTGSVKPDTYPVRGTLSLAATSEQVIATPRFPRMKVKLQVEPSRESWAAVQKLLDDKRGVCGFVLDRVDVMGKVREAIAKGFVVRLPTEKVRAMAIPVAIEPSITVRDRTVALALSVGHLQITEQMMWLGVDVGIEAPAAP